MHQQPEKMRPLIEQMFIRGPAGKLETLITVSTTPNPHNAIAIVCHPHPLHEGTMHNKVVHTMARTFSDLGIPVARFNFRGVEASEGTFDNAIGEVADLAAVIAFMQNRYPDRAVWLAGFSFGAYIALKASVNNQAAYLLTVAPAIHLYDTSNIEIPNCPWLLIMGDKDEIVSPDAVFRWTEKITPAPDMVQMEGAGHFFHRRLVELKNILIQHIQTLKT